jgi:Kef-type K+ transport system membrane component KefB
VAELFPCGDDTGGGAGRRGAARRDDARTVIGFGTLAVFALAGLAGPLLGLSRRWFVPLVAGEILAGVLAGPHVTGAIDPKQPTIAFLGEVGFAMLMLSVGMHLPLREPRLVGSLRTGSALAVIAGALAVPAGLLAAAIAGDSHAVIYAVVLASMLALAGALVILNVAIRLLAARLMRTPASGALAASAQLGVPAAVASLGLSTHVIGEPTATAIVASALVSLAVGSVGVQQLVRGELAAATQAGAGSAGAAAPSSRGGSATPAAA